MSGMNTIYKMGYIYKKDELKKFGNVVAIKQDYELYLKVTIKAKVGAGWASVQVDKRSKTFKLPLTLWSFKVHKYSSSSKTLTTNSISDGGRGEGFFDESLDDKLGGNKELLGG